MASKLNTLPIPGQTPPKELQMANLAKHIDHGVQLLQTSQWQAAVNYLSTAAHAESAGIYLNRSSGYVISQTPPDNQIPSIANFTACRSFYWYDSNTINVCGLTAPTPELIPQKLWHEVALIHMEEWLHAYQNATKTPLVSDPNHEIDVAQYLLSQNITLTDTYLARYDRGLTLGIPLTRDDSLDDYPALSRGRFITVQRSDKTYESDWQIIDFDNQGNIIAGKGRNGMLVTIEEFNLLNPRGIHPFSGADNFSQLFSILNQYEALFGFSEKFDIAYVKKAINQARKKKTLEAFTPIPRAGGLRLKVKELFETETGIQL